MKTRHALLTFALSASLGLLTAADAQAQGLPPTEAPDPTAVSSYGPLDLQNGELWLPEGEGPFPVAITVHGGCWLARLGQGTLRPAAAALARDGIATWNINYRRLGHDGGGWPGTFLDVGAAIDHLREVAREHPLDLNRVAIAGHSSGAHLAVWAAGRTALPTDSEIRGAAPLPIGAAVGIDGPMDLASWREDGRDAQVCGEPVIEALMGGDPAARPDRYAQASPVQMPPMDADIYLTPAALMLATGAPNAMVQRAGETGETVTVIPVPESDHFQLIMVDHPAWQTVRETILRALGLR